MKLLVDANIFLAVIMNEPEKKEIIKRTEGSELISPEIMPYEIGNALTAMSKRKSIKKNQIIDYFNIFNKIPVRLTGVRIDQALQIASKYNIYAYDAYYLETAKRLNLTIITLDNKMKETAGKLIIPVMEVL